MAAGAVCSYPAHPPASLVFVIPAMVMFGIAALIHGQLIGNFIAIVELVLILNYLVIIAEFYRSSVRGMILHDEKSMLADNLAEAHAALQREGAAKSEFLAHMSHELRTPLNAIIGFSDVINSKVYGPMGNAKYEEYLQDIKSSADHLLDIVNEILDLARIEAGELTLDIAEVSPRYIADFTERLVEQQALQKGLKLDITVEPGLAHRQLMTDEVRLKQVVINLMSNAIKFTDRGGTVGLTVGARDGSACFAISDTGPGMTKEQVAKALQPFGQVGTPVQRRQGTGLGLPLSRQLVARLGGTFDIASKPGVGTTVTIALPLRD
jgi:signal transduction histidine kinase